MNTLGIAGIFFCLYLIFRLISLTYSMRMFLDDMGSEFARLRDYLVLLFCGLGFATAFAPVVMSDLYSLPVYGTIRALEKSEGPELAGKGNVVFVGLWLSFILIYDLLVMRKKRVSSAKLRGPAKLKNREVSVEDVDRRRQEMRRGIRKNWLAALVAFGALSVGEGFIQDLLYVPYVKPFFCDKFSILCQ